MQYPVPAISLARSKSGGAARDRETKMSKMTRVLATAFLVATMGASAQVTPPSATPIRVNFIGTDVMNCYGENERCIVPVYVQSDGTATGCVVRMHFGEIRVYDSKLPNGKKVKIVWMLQLADSNEDKSQYQFHQGSGVKPNSGQDPNNEFRDKVRDGDDSGNQKRRFRWTSHHPGVLGSPVSYAINIERVVSGVPNLCTVDPKIVNQN
jgi:hypothetical protein